MTFSAVVVGCGRIGGGYGGQAAAECASHASSYTCEERTDLAGAADTDPSALRRFGERWGVDRLYADYREMLSAVRPDVVSVCTWDEGHLEVIRVALASGVRAIVCEKPLAPTALECREAVDACREAGILLCVAYQRRWERLHRRARKLVERGELGSLLGVSGYYVGGLRHNGCAMINLCRYFAGEVDEVYALSTQGHRPDDLGAAMRFHGGCHGTLMAADRDAYSMFEIDVLGSAGRLRFSDAGYTVQLWEVEEDTRYPGFRRLREVNHGWGVTEMDSALARGISEVIDCLERRTETGNTGTEALADMRIIEAICQSAQLGEAIAMNGGENR